MRFNLFGFKGNLDTVDGTTTTKQPKEDKGGVSTVICTGYRPFSDFDRPIEPPPEQINHANQASTSSSATNGVIPKSKSGKLKIQQDPNNKDKQVDKAKATKPDKSKEQKQQKDAIKAQKAEEKIKLQQLKEQQALEKKKKQQGLAGKEKKKQPTATSSGLIILGGPEKSGSISTAAFTQKAKASNNTKSKSKNSKAPGTPPMPAVAAVNPRILAKQQQRKEEKDKTKQKSGSSEDVQLRHKDKSSSRQRIKTKEEILLSDKAKSLPNLTNPDLDKSSHRNGIPDAISAKTTKSNDENQKHKSTPPKLIKAAAPSIPKHKRVEEISYAEIRSPKIASSYHQDDLPEDGSISIVSGKTTTTPSKDENANKHKSITPGARLVLPPIFPQRPKSTNSDSDDYEDDRNNDGSIFIVSGKTNAAASRDDNSKKLNGTPPIAPQRSKKTEEVIRNDLPDDGSIFIVSGKTTSAGLPQPLQRSKTTEEVPSSKAKSLPNLTDSDLDDYDDYQNDLKDDGSLFIVSGKTTAAPSNDDNQKKSTLIFMTEGDEDDETTEYAYPTNYTSKSSFNSNETKNARQGDTRLQSDYSSHAANIFFGNADPEPAPRNRKFLVRDDDDNASQTSA